MVSRCCRIFALALCILGSTGLAQSVPAPAEVTHFTPPLSLSSPASGVSISSPTVVPLTPNGVMAYVPYYDVSTTPVRSAVAGYSVPLPFSLPSASAFQGYDAVTAFGSMFTQVSSLNASVPSVIAVATEFASSSISGSFVAAASIAAGGRATVDWKVNRRNDTAMSVLTVGSPANLVVFFRPVAGTTMVDMVAVDSNLGATLWTKSWAAPRPSDPVYYNGRLYFFWGEVLYSINAQTGAFSGAVKQNPCNVTAAVSYRWNVAVATFSQDANGPLDAFVIHANINISSSVQASAFCRYSHTTGRAYWVRYEPYSVLVQDVYGGGGNLFMSIATFNSSTGSVTGYNTLVYNATTGVPVAFPYVRTAVDARAFPRVVPFLDEGCSTGTLVQQLSGKTIAYCAEVPAVSIWTSNAACHFPALAVVTLPKPDYVFVACASIGTSMTLLNAGSGLPVWTVAFYISQPPATDGSSIYAVDINSRLARFSIAPAGLSGGAAPGSDGLSGGETALVVIVVLVALGGGVFAVVRSTKRARSRRADDASGSMVNQQEYGGVE